MGTQRNVNWHYVTTLVGEEVGKLVHVKVSV